jgi:hypothetical protein
VCTHKFWQSLEEEEDEEREKKRSGALKRWKGKPLEEMLVAVVYLLMEETTVFTLSTSSSFLSLYIFLYIYSSSTLLVPHCLLLSLSLSHSPVVSSFLTAFGGNNNRSSRCTVGLYEMVCFSLLIAMLILLPSVDYSSPFGRL